MINLIRKKIICVIMSICILDMIMCCYTVKGESISVVETGVENTNDLGITSKACILMEASTGKVIFENNADEILSPASITKIMTLILIFQSIHEGKLKLNDTVTTSEYAKSMGGSQVFLETGEQQTVDTLIKCIIVSSGNDASVTMAEHIAGSEQAFVKLMNEKAQSLGMKNTVFLDCCGLSDSMDHHTTARDVAIMSRELITKYPEVLNYSKIWQENIVHVTNKGSSEFTLSNTNKLMKQYEWATGLKTGSTSLAKYCLSATASKNDINLIAVIMAAPDYKVRFSEAITLLNYGYSVVSLYRDDKTLSDSKVRINGGTKKEALIYPEKTFTYVCTNGEKTKKIHKKVFINKSIDAPVEKDSKVGEIKYFIEDKEIGSVNIMAKDKIPKAGYVDYFKKMCYKYIL